MGVLHLFISSPLNPRFAGSNLTKVDGFLSAIKIHSTTSFSREVNPGSHIIHLQHVKEPVI
jgi:hypothetical protein